MPRLFMAVRVPPTDPLRRVLRRLSDIKGVKAVEPENLHFTLRFLGDVSDATRDGLVGLLQGAHMDHAPFRVHVNGTSAFPKVERPSVVWAAVDEGGAKGLRAIARHVDALCDETGLGPRDKPFVPHLTLARVKVKGGRGIEEAATIAREEHGTDYGETPVERWHLVHSVLSAQGPSYQDIAEVPLG